MFQDQSYLVERGRYRFSKPADRLHKSNFKNQSETLEIYIRAKP